MHWFKQILPYLDLFRRPCLVFPTDVYPYSILCFHKWYSTYPPDQNGRNNCHRLMGTNKPQFCSNRRIVSRDAMTILLNPFPGTRTFNVTCNSRPRRRYARPDACATVKTKQNIRTSSPVAVTKLIAVPAPLRVGRRSAAAARTKA
ncbi:hypothetical protein FJTKL_10273 [Diaporthe vaccinii]|uniref:Uncharacterized protein n=1 Tax=Diaporthe vaccinii TaxID=105482 RepID=A0ABR4EKG9_9PEZI